MYEYDFLVMFKDNNKLDDRKSFLIIVNGVLKMSNKISDKLS